jgi:hypothetical protein
MGSTAQACRFAADAKPPQWYEWAEALFAADVSAVQSDAQKALDVISVRIVETFKGPKAAAATLEVPARMWASCGLERPAAGARVLVAMNPNRDILLVPLTPSYADLLRAHRGVKP